MAILHAYSQEISNGMWQKLNRLDTHELEKARIQIINASQLVSAVPRSYYSSDNSNNLLKWNNESYCIESCDVDSKKSIKISLDIQQFVLSILSDDDHKEHLVLSGITYPMAFGWMKIKLDSFDLESDLFDDSTDYSLERILGPNEDLYVTNQQVFNELAIYYANAFLTLSQLKNDLGVDHDIYIDQDKLSLYLTVGSSETEYKVRFTPGDKNFLEPHFAMQVSANAPDNLKNSISPSGFWNNKDWTGMVLLASDFLTLDPEKERIKVYDFLKFNCDSIKGHNK